MQAIKEVEGKNGESEVLEKRVESVDYRSSPQQGLETRKVEIVHQSRPTKAADFSTSGGVLAGAAAAVAKTLQSAKEAISRK